MDRVADSATGNAFAPSTTRSLTGHIAPTMYVSLAVQHVGFLTGDRSEQGRSQDFAQERGRGVCNSLFAAVVTTAGTKLSYTLEKKVDGGKHPGPPLKYACGSEFSKLRIVSRASEKINGLLRRVVGFDNKGLEVEIVVNNFQSPGSVMSHRSCK